MIFETILSMWIVVEGVQSLKPHLAEGNGVSCSSENREAGVFKPGLKCNIDWTWKEGGGKHF